MSLQKMQMYDKYVIQLQNNNYGFANDIVLGKTKHYIIKIIKKQVICNECRMNESTYSV